MDAYEKLEALKDLISSYDRLAVAFSGGVDSTLLLAVAHGVLGDRCLAVIATSPTYPRREYESAHEWVQSRGIPFVIIESEELEIPGFSGNPPERCYYCKKELFEKIYGEVRKFGIAVVADGSNYDDTLDFRPGMRASRELGVKSPLMECGLTKEDIRLLSRHSYHLSTSDKQPMACMASRIPYGSRVSRDKLAQIEMMEDFLSDAGFRVFRARHHGDLLRLELGRDEMTLLREENLVSEVVDVAKRIGFVYVTMDLQGFRSGSMNEALQKKGHNTPY
ncbi:MAG TPA: ATP-dependent sacrificial sulfur transferase LarE [Deltaproteobacteria bacterium]|nr:ATP-dependent sacrificial sulfur transferase LarE [Deltaproteobacteria bacterium]